MYPNIDTFKVKLLTVLLHVQYNIITSLCDSFAGNYSIEI